MIRNTVFCCVVALSIACTGEKGQEQAKTQTKATVASPTEKVPVPATPTAAPDPENSAVSPTTAVAWSGDWTKTPPKGCSVGTAAIRAGGVINARNMASMKARSGLAQMVQGLLSQVGGKGTPARTVVEGVDANGKKTRVVTTTTSNVDLVGARMVKSKAAGRRFLAMFCLDPADVGASFRKMDGLSEENRAAVLTLAQKEYAGLGAALAALEGKAPAAVGGEKPSGR